MASSQTNSEETSKFSAPVIRLIPWNPDSEEHVQRMVLQRKACGWSKGLVPSWITLQKEGDISLFWILIEDEEKMSLHCSKYPKEKEPLQDSATYINGSTILPTIESFTPIGHISLDSSHPDYPSMGNKVAGLYSISRFYISRAIQSAGIGRAAMEEVERRARSNPINAKTLALYTIANEFEGRDERLKAQGRPKPVISLEDWYTRRGYVTFERLDGAWEEEDKTGKKWPCTAVVMRKELGSMGP